MTVTRERTMSVVCECGHEYGAWRSQCPVCGIAQPRCKHGNIKSLCNECRSPKRERVVREREKRKDECVLCRRRVAPGKRRSTTCPHCHEPVHEPCLKLHDAACAAFQQARAVELKRLEQDNLTVRLMNRGGA